MYYFIINPKSRSGFGAHIWQIVKQKLDEWNISYSYYYTHYEFHAIKLTEKICREHPGTKKIVVIGGDGTLNEVINGIFSFQDVLLGYIPSGSSNDFAKGLSIPTDPIKALTSILKGNHFTYCDYGEIQTPQKELPKKFAVGAGIGLDASICKEALDSSYKKTLNKFHLGKLSYLAIGMKQLLHFKPFDATFTMDGHTTISLKRVYFAAAMLYPYEGGGLAVAPHATPASHKLSVCIFYDIPKWKAFFMIPLIATGGHKKIKHGVKLFRCNSLSVHTNQPVLLHTDGEFAGRSNEIYLHNKKQRLRIIR